MHSNVSVGLSTPNAAGEQVDLLNPSSMDIDGPTEDDDMDEKEDGEVLYDESSSTHYQASQIRSTLNPTTNLRQQKVPLLREGNGIESDIPSQTR